MTHRSLPDLLTMIRAARRASGVEQDMLLGRAENTCRAMLAPLAVCILDGRECAWDCPTLAPQGGVCGRKGR